MQKGKVIALDFGTKRIGIATGDFETRIAFPTKVVRNSSEVLDEITLFTNEMDAKLIVVGLPLDMRDSEVDSAMLVVVRKFVSRLRNNLAKHNLKGVEVNFFDERLTTHEAKTLIQATDFSHKNKKMEKDAISAQIILQRFFDSEKN